MSEDNRKDLLEAFERLKAGKPIRTEINRKITPSSVEDEADLGRSILRNNNDYSDIFDLVVVEKNKRAKQGNSAQNDKKSSTDEKVKELRKNLASSNKRYNELEDKHEQLLARNAELTQIIVSKRYNEAFFKNTSNAMELLASEFKKDTDN